MRSHLLLAVLLVSAVHPIAPAAAQDFPLTDAKGLTAHGATVDTADFLGRKALRLVMQGQVEDSFVVLPGVEFQDGTIEADVAVRIMTPPGVRMPGFIGIAFRASPDASGYDLFYIRPGNARAQDQAMRNHATQYGAAPGYGWYELRRAWPGVYESHADLRTDAWTHIRIDVAGRLARLYLNGSTEPTLIVDGMKGERLRGAVALYGYAGQESYFSNVRVTSATPQPIKNGSDAAGAWDVKIATDAGPMSGTLQLQRQGSTLSGTWSGALGQNRPVTGSWRDGYVELSFTGEWPKEAGNGAPGEVTATLAGWIDGDSGKGRGKVEARADGQWTATRKP